MGSQISVGFLNIIERLLEGQIPVYFKFPKPKSPHVFDTSFCYNCDNEYIQPVETWLILFVYKFGYWVAVTSSSGH